MSAQALSLRFSAPAECPKKSAMQARIVSLLAEAEPKVYTLRVVAKVSARRRADYQITLQIDTDTHHAERALRGSRCDELIEAAAWLVALTVDPALSDERQDEQVADAAETDSSAARAATEQAGAVSAGTSHAHDTSANAVANGAARSSAQSERGERRAAKAKPAPNARPAETRTVSAAVEPAKPASAPWPRSFRTGGTLGMITGDGAGIQAALSGFVGYGIGVFYSQARVQGSMPRETPLSPVGELRIWALTSELTECALFGRSLRAGPCLGASLVRTSAELNGLASSHERAYLWGAANGGLQLFWLVARRIELSFAALARLPLSPRPRYVVEGLETVGSTQTWSADVRLGLGFALR